MVFSKLSTQEKEAFFGLLDEYFASRPEVLGSISPATAASAASAVSRLASASGGAGKSTNPFAANVDIGRVAALAGRTQSSIPGSEVDKLVTHKTSVFSALKKTGAPGAVAIPPAFGAPRNTYGPPPVRRAEAEQEGEWAEVLYDYSSEDAGDLAIEAGTRVLVTAKSSEDWWTGRIQGQGKEGLFPASYVKLL